MSPDVISPIISPSREQEPNAVGLSLTKMHGEIEDAVARTADRGDANLHYFDGLSMFGEDLVQDYLPAQVHPNGDGYEIMGRNFSNVVFKKITVPGV